MTLLIGILFGVTMLYNVWMVIWPNQQIVIANARNVQAGGEADPNAPAAARAGAMASRQNTIFSLPLLVFMVGASHFYGTRATSRTAPGGGEVVRLPPDRRHRARACSRRTRSARSAAAATPGST